MADADHAGTMDTVAIAGLQDAPDMDAAQFAERQPAPVFSGGCKGCSWLVDLCGEFVERAHQTREVERLAEKIVRSVLDGRRLRRQPSG